MSEAMGQRAGRLSLVDDLNARIEGGDAWLEQQARADERVSQCRCSHFRL
jgi:hypothetical protein